MAYSRETVMNFILNGKIKSSESIITFDGFEARGDAGNALNFYKNGQTDVASQSPTERGDDNSFTDSEGYVYTLTEGSVVSYDGTNDWFGGNFGADGLGVYTLDSTGWVALRGILVTVSPNMDWDVEIPFNDGGELKAGYATRNTYGNKAIDFTRSSTTGNINKSNVSETIAIDEPSISSKGAALYGKYTNLITASEGVEYLNEDWTRSNGGVDATGTTLICDNISLNEIDEQNTSAAAYMYQSIVPSSTDATVTLSAFISAGTASYCALTIRGYNSGTPISSYTIVLDPNNGTVVSEPFNATYTLEVFSDCVFVSITATINDSATTNLRCGFLPATDSIGAGNTVVGSTFIGGVQATETSSAMPYMKTESAIATRESDIASLPLMNNLPYSGTPFTIALDSIVNAGESADRRFLSQEDNFYLGMNTSDYFEANALDSSGALVTCTSSIVNDGLDHTYSMTFSGSTLALYIGGVEVGAVACDGLTLDLTEDLYVGSRDGASNHINSTIANIRIKHAELTSAQLVAQGEPF